jgi:phosphomannomutase
MTSAFHAYDVRGLWQDGIDLDLAFKLGLAFGQWSKAKTILVAHDARLHSSELSVRLVEGLAAAGCAVTDLGLASTPQMHFFQIRDGFEAGVMVTASHNPKEYHGFKFFDGRGGSVSYEKGLREIEAMLKLVVPPGCPAGLVTAGPRLDEYIDFVAGQARGLALKRRIVIDTANGSGGPAAAALVKRLGLDAVIINATPDGNFPGHDPNPLKEESRRQASEKVRATGAALGAILDGDGDRIIFLDERGEAVENYFMSALISRQLLKATPGAAIVYDLISSRVLPEEIEALGGKAVISRVGYTYLYDRMVETGAVFGAETSGHVYFKVNETYYTESALYALVVVMALLEKSTEPLSRILEPLRARYFQARELNIRAVDKAKAIALVKEHFQQGRLDELDGVSIAFDDFWFNVRASNTEPLIRVRLEARSKDIALAKISEIEQLLGKI